jgi:hypothetical protein
MSATLIADFAELEQYDTSKGTIRFPVDKPPGAALIKKLVKARVAQTSARQQAHEGDGARSRSVSRAVMRRPYQLGCAAVVHR